MDGWWLVVKSLPASPAWKSSSGLQAQGSWQDPRSSDLLQFILLGRSQKTLFTLLSPACACSNERDTECRLTIQTVRRFWFCLDEVFQTATASSTLSSNCTCWSENCHLHFFWTFHIFSSLICCFVSACCFFPSAVLLFFLCFFFFSLLRLACAIRNSEPCFSGTGSSACSCLTNSRSPLDRVAWRPIMHLETGGIFSQQTRPKE